MVLIAVAVHTETPPTKDYSSKIYCKDNWLGYRAWIVWKKHPKREVCSAAPDIGERSEAQTLQGVMYSTPSINSDGLEVGTLEEDEMRRVSCVDGNTRQIEKRNVKLVRQEKL